MKIEIEIISKELIKPSSPTPQHLDRRIPYSFIDQTQPNNSLSFIHFYSRYQQQQQCNNFQKCTLLKKSLSEVLTIFYPVAGRVRNNQSYIDCNDEGVLFVEAKASCTLAQVLGDRNPSNNNYFTPFGPYEAGDLAGFSQITWLTCGGCAISFGMSHRLGDASSMFNFLNTWAAIATSKSNFTSPSSFGYASLFPPVKIGTKIDHGTMFSKEKVVTKLFSFNGSTIAAIKDKYSRMHGEGGEGGGGRRRISRVEAMTGFILGRFMAATNQTVKSAKQSCMVIQAMNLRTKMVPPLPETSFGNFSTGATVQADIDLDKDEYCFGIVERMRDSARNIGAEFNKLKESKEQVLNFFSGIMDNLQKEEEIIAFIFSSLHTFSMYESDFGWGKPVWIGLTPAMFKNNVIFFGTRDGEGIEAQICLKEKDMAKFERDHQLVAHLSNAKFKAPSRL